MSITKGPWAGPVNNADRFEIQGDGKRIAVVDKIDDAILMLAAPDLLAALQAISDGFANGSIAFTKKRQADSDPYHPANVLMCAALEKAVQHE